MTQTRKVVFWLPAMLWAATLFVLSAQPLPKIGPQFHNVDKIHHLIAYAVLGALVMFALRRAHNLPLPKAALLAILIASAYGATDEFHQRFVPPAFLRCLGLDGGHVGRWYRRYRLLQL